MAESQATALRKEGEGDDTSFIRTEDVVCLLCSSGDGAKRGYLAADGFGSQFCYLEAEAREEEACELWKCTFQLEEALSVHAMSTYRQKKKQGHRKILMYGQAILLRHQGTKKLLRCLSTSPANDKLSHHIGFSEKPGMVDETCWFMVCPSSKQRSDGEKVRAGDDIFLRNVSNERYLSAQLSYLHSVEGDTQKQSNIVQASFQQSVWTLHIVCSGSAREAAIGYVNGTDVVHLLHRHGAEDSLSVAARDCDKNVAAERTISGCREVCYQCPLQAPLRTLWRVELFKMKFGGGFTGWGQPFRLRHVVTGKFLGVKVVQRKNVTCSVGEGAKEESELTDNVAGKKHVVSLLEPSEATFKTSAFCFFNTASSTPMPTTAATSSKKLGKEMMGEPQVKFGDSEVLLVHLDTGKLVGCPVSERSQKLLGGRKKRKVLMQCEIHQGQSFTVTRASEEKAKAADVVQLMEGTMRNFVQRVLHSPSTDQASSEQSFTEQLSHNLLHLLTDLIHYFHFPPPPTSSSITHLHPPNSNTLSSSSPLPSQAHDLWQTELCLLRERQDLFKKQGMLSLTLNVIIEISQRRHMECDQNISAIHRKLYELLAAMIRGNRKNCSEFATEKWLKVFIDHLSLPRFTHDVLEVIQCLLTDSPEVLNIITKDHIQVIVNLLLSRGRDEAVMRLLSSLCVCSEVAMRDKQRLIHKHLLDCRDLLIQTSLHDHIHCLHPGLYVGSHEGSAMHQKWYYEAEVTKIPDQHTDKHFHIRIGWAHATLFRSRPSSNSFLTTSGGIGDDLYSIAFDGQYFWFGGESFQSRPPKKKLQRQDMLALSPTPPDTCVPCGTISVGDVIGCYLDLSKQEVWFTKNGCAVPGHLRFSHMDDMITPAISMSNSVSVVLSFGKHMGPFSHPPPSDFAGLFEAAVMDNKEVKLHSFVHLGTTEDLSVSGPSVLANYQGFVPAPIDTGGKVLPDPLLSIRDKLAHNLHEVWAKDKIEAGYRYSQVRNDDQKLHPLLCSVESLSPEDSQYDYSMAYEILATLLVLGYHIVPPDKQAKLKYQELDVERYQQSNGYLPRPLDLDSVSLEDGLMELVEKLAENCHNVWAAGRIKQGWTYGKSKDASCKRNPLLVPYEMLDTSAKKSNWDSAYETVRSVLALGCSVVPPPSSFSSLSIHQLTREFSQSQVKIRNFRGQTCFAVKSGKWYYEVKLLTDGMMRIGWASPSFPAHLGLGDDEHSFAFDGFLACKWHNGRESFGQRWSAGDVIGCLLDLDGGQIAFSLNGEMLHDTLRTSTIAFEGVTGVSLVPAITLAAGQRAQLNFGRSEEALCSDYSSLGYRALCSSSALHFNIPLWYSSPHESIEVVSPSHPRLNIFRKVSNLVPNSKSYTVLSVSCRGWDYSQSPQPECLRLNAGVVVTPDESHPSFTRQSSVHPRPGPFSPTPTADVDIYRAFADYFSTQRHIVSYTAVVPAGQDPRSVFLGWTTAQFCYIASQFQTAAWNSDSDFVCGQKLECVSAHKACSSSTSDPTVVEYSHSSAYLVCVNQLLTGFTEQNLDVSVRVVCTLDLLSGHMTFSTAIPGQEVSSGVTLNKMSLQVKKRCKLFPTVIMTPSTEKLIDLDFTPDLCCHSILSTLIPSSSGTKFPHCTPRFKLMVLTPNQWVRQAFRSVPYSSEITSGGAVRVQSHKEPTYSIYATLPEEDVVMNLLELSENDKLLKFHICSLEAYKAVSSRCNISIAKRVSEILDSEQLLHCLNLRGMHFSLRAAYIELFNTLHLELAVESKLLTHGEFILPLSECHRSAPLFPTKTKTEEKTPTAKTPFEMDPALENSAAIVHNVTSFFSQDLRGEICKFSFSVQKLKDMVFYGLEKLLSTKYYQGIILPRSSSSEIFVPLLTLLDNLLVVGAVQEDRDLKKILALLEPEKYAPKGTPFREGLLSPNVATEEPIKQVLCSLLHHLCDCQVLHRVESTVTFATSYVETLQKDQRERYDKIFDKKPKEFRSSPEKQMEALLSFRQGVSGDCPTAEKLQKVLQDFHNDLRRHCGITKTSVTSTDKLAEKSLKEKLKMLAQSLHQALFSNEEMSERKGERRGEASLHQLIMSTMIKWAQQPIHSPDLIQQIFALLYRQCDQINELTRALQKTYVIDVLEDGQNKLNFNIPAFQCALSSLRLLMNIGMGKEEEQMLEECLRTISHSDVFYCHPTLLRSLGVHLIVLGLMRSYLGISVSGLEDDHFLTARRKMKMAMSKEGLPAPVEWCCKFLCSFARVSAENQRVLFDHISYLLEYSERNSGCMTCRGCTPLDVATAIIRDNAELCLALDDAHLSHVVSLLVATTTSMTGGGGSMEQGGGEEGKDVPLGMVAVGSMMCEWAPNGGEKCLDFLQCAVWADGEQIQENAHVIMRLLIHHPECLGPALAGEAIGLQRVYEEALDHMLDTPVFGSSRASPRDSTDLGSASPLKGTLSRGETIVYPESSPHGERHRTNSYMNLNLMSTRLVLSFYTSLVRLLAYCAPIKVSVNKLSNGNGSDEVPGLSDVNGTTSGGQSGGDDTVSGNEGGHSGSGTTSGTCSTKVNGDEWTRNILSNLISMEDVKGILSLPFAHDGHGGIVPTHKEAVLLFLSHVYGLSDRQLLCDLLTDAFLPDIKTALKLASSKEHSPLYSPLIHYLCFSVFPLLTQYAAMFPQILSHLHVIINLFMCCFRLSTNCQLTDKQLAMITAFFIATLKCLHPGAMMRFMPKVIINIPNLQPHSIMYMELVGSHYSYFARYYESGQRCIGLATEEEKVWSALVIYRLLDALSSKLPHEKLERSCVTCLQAVSCSIVPDTLLPPQSQLDTMYRSSATGYDPTPANISRVTIKNPDVKTFMLDFANFLHDCWIFEKQSAGWTYGPEYCEKNRKHPNLRPLCSLPAEVKAEYLTPIEEAIKYLNFKGWGMSKVREPDISGISKRTKTVRLGKKKTKKKMDRDEEELYEPEVLDLSKVSASVLMLGIAETMAEDAHERWASNLKKTSKDYHFNPFFQPYELVDDVSTEERRGYALDMLRYMRISGFDLVSSGNKISSLTESRQSSTYQEKFSLQFFDKFLQLLSQNLEPVYYSRVLFPTLASYLHKNRAYFRFMRGRRLSHSASKEEKLTILKLFCRVMDYAHTHKRTLFSSIHRRGSKLIGKTETVPDSSSHEKGALFRETHSLIEVIVRCLDLESIANISGSVATECPSIITFFEQALATIINVKSEMTLQKELRNSHLQSYGLNLLIPSLTALFNQVGICEKDGGCLLMKGTVLNHCDLIFRTLIEMATGATPVFVGTSPIVVIGKCMGAISRVYPEPFLEKQLFGFDLDSLLHELNVASTQGSTAGNVLYVVDIVIPVLSNYVAKWWKNSASSTGRGVVTTEHVDYTLSQILSMVAAHFTLPLEKARWFVRIIDSCVALPQKCSLDLLASHFLPMCVGLGERAVALWHAEQLITTHITTSSTTGIEGYIEELVKDYSVLVRDLATTLVFLIVFLKMHSEKLRDAGKETMAEDTGPSYSREDMASNINALFTALAEIFHCWFSSPNLRRTFLTGTQWLAQHSVLKNCSTVQSPKKDNCSEQTYNLLMFALNLLLPILDQYLTRSDRDLVSSCSEKLAEKGATYIDVKTELIKQLDIQQQAASREHLGHKLIRQMTQSLSVQPSSTADRAEQIVALARVRHRMKVVGIRDGEGARLKWRQLLTRRKRKAVLSCFLAVPYFQLKKHRAINLFLQSYCSLWLESTEGHTHTILSTKLLDHQDYLATCRSLPTDYHDPLTQLFTMMKRCATSGGSFDHELFTAYPNAMSKIITGCVVDERSSSDENVTVAYQNYYKRRAELFARQNQLSKRGAASMVLLVITAARGDRSSVTHSILRLGIALLEEGNDHIQGEMLDQLKSMDVGFLASVAHLISGCSVLDWNAYERHQKSEMMHSSKSLAITKVLSESAFTEDLFRFLQLLCEGHNTAFQNYLRTQAGNTTTVNIITCTVDYLLRLQESISDFYWHYSSQETIDLLARDSLLKAFRVAKQVFRTLTEYIQGPCVQNQETLARSRLLDAVSGFLHVFAILQRKLYQDTSQMELLRELLGLQEEMFILLLSMLEGSAMSSQLGRLMVDMLVESEQWIQDIMAFFSIFIKLKDATTSKAFKEYDLNKDGLISYREFEMAMESQQRYSKEEIVYLMECADTNKDGLLDYKEFTERFHQPAENIGFHLCVLIVHLSEHLPQEKRLQQFKISPQGRELMEHFEQGMGCIEIQGKSGRIEKVYFEVKQSRLIQWNETQIQESRRNFLHSVEMGSHKKKLEGFVSFCEDTIFEMDYADKISGSEQQSRESRAFQHRLRHTKALQTVQKPFLPRLWGGVRAFNEKYRPLQRVIGIVLMLWALIWALISATLIPLCRRAGARLLSLLPQERSPTQQPSTTTTSSEGGSRLSNLAKRGGLHLSMPSNTLQSQVAPSNPSTNVPNPKHGVKMPAQLTKSSSSSTLTAHQGSEGRRHSLSSNGKTNSSFPLPWKQQGVSLKSPTGSFNIQQLTLRYDRTRMRRPSSESPQNTSQADQTFPSGSAESYVPKITLSTRGWQAFLARHYYRLNNLKLLVTFLINIILLSFTVQSLSLEQATLNNSVCPSTPPPSPPHSNSSILTPHSPSPSCMEEIQLVWDPFYLRLLSALHFVLSLLLIMSYWSLKVPLIIFKREKDIARRLETKQMWVWSQPKSPEIANIFEWGVGDWWAWFHDMWDGIVISAPSFPRNYWDKQVKDRVYYQFEGQNSKLVAQRLGMCTRSQFESHSKWDDFVTTLHSLGDLRYTVWVLGVVLSNMMVLYHFLYCGLSFLGLHQNSFYFSIHLLDLVMNFKLLRTVLYSVLHNGKQLVMTVLMTCVVIYLYTVIAFNYFRKFYIKQNPAGGEHVYTCDSMSKCFIYHIDQGLRAGGGIGDVLQSATGDPDEFLRLLFDVTFFFFVIVMLLAIIQGLIIDAFGELRDREESITADMNNKCFVCGLPKAEFDHIAHGFDNHVTREHNTAHYMFFLLYLIRKQESEFSGQESYVWEMYLKRKWDFFPVGDSFRGQEERRTEGIRTKPKGLASQFKHTHTTS